jgi:hypothetical protein
VYGLGACGRSAPGSGIKVSFLRWLPADWVGVGSRLQRRGHSRRRRRGRNAAGHANAGALPPGWPLSTQLHSIANR